MHLMQLQLVVNAEYAYVYFLYPPNPIEISCVPHPDYEIRDFSDKLFSNI